MLARRFFCAHNNDNNPMRRFTALILLVCFLLASARAESDAPALVSIIIDDIGDQRVLGQRAVDLPGQVTCAFLPLTPFAAALAERAHAQGKEVILHLPMQARHEWPLGPAALRLDMTETEFLSTVATALASVPHVRGVNNHMGSLLTRHPGHMDWLMGVLRTSGHLYFVDSRTTRRSVAHMLAREHGVPSVQRDVFLDNRAEPQAIRRQLERLVAHARRHGSAVAIGHPYPATLEVLAEALPDLEAQGVRLVPISELIAHREQRRSESWRLSLSP